MIVRPVLSQERISLWGIDVKRATVRRKIVAKMMSSLPCPFWTKEAFDYSNTEQLIAPFSSIPFFAWISTSTRNREKAI